MIYFIFINNLFIYLKIEIEKIITLKKLKSISIVIIIYL